MGPKTGGNGHMKTITVTRFYLQIEQMDEKSTVEVDTFSVRVNLDDIRLDPMPDGNKKCNISNPKTLKGKVTKWGVARVSGADLS